MEYELPSKNNYTIYSKTGCPYCVKAKTLLQAETVEIIDCDDYIIDDKPAFLKFMAELIGKEYKTFPMVFNKDGKFIGGFTELKPYYEEELKSKNNFPDPFAMTGFLSR